MNSLLTVKILDTTTTQTSKAYTMYEMEVSGSILEPYTIFKRYSDFHALHATLLKRVQSDHKLKRLKEDDMLIVPDLPKKRFGKNSKKVIENRQHKLQLYLRTLLMSEPLCKTDFIMDFLAVPKAWLHMIEPQKEKTHTYSRAKQDNDRRMKEKEDEEMKLALALSASLAEVDINKRRERTPSPSPEYPQQNNMNNMQYVQQNRQELGYTGQGPQQLPPHWTQFRTADGRVFYQNDETMESTWDRPVPVIQSNVNMPVQGQYAQPQQQQQSQPQRNDPFSALYGNNNGNVQGQQQQTQYRQPQQQQQTYTQPQQQTQSQYPAQSFVQPQQAQSQYHPQPQQQTQYAQPQKQQTYAQPQPAQTQQNTQYAQPQQQQSYTTQSYAQPQLQKAQYTQPQQTQQTQRNTAEYGQGQQQLYGQEQQESMKYNNNNYTSNVSDISELVNFVNAGTGDDNNGNAMSGNANQGNDMWNVLQTSFK